MTTKVKLLLFLKDKYMGDYGFFIWVLPAAIIFFSTFLYIAITISFSKYLWNVEGIIFLIIMYTICVLSLLWFLYESILAMKIIQEFKLFNKEIGLITYFRRKINLSIKDISLVSILDQNSFLLKKHRAVQTDAPCLQVITKGNKRYLITPHMERFDELKAKLTEIVEQNKKTN